MVCNPSTWKMDDSGVQDQLQLPKESETGLGYNSKHNNKIKQANKKWLSLHSTFTYLGDQSFKYTIKSITTFKSS